jgi:hypothetical protein
MSFIKITIDQQELRNMQEDLARLFPTNDRARILGTIMRKAIKPALDKLREVTPVGPTGNLALAASSKVVTYSRDGVAVGLIGYQRAGREPSVSAGGGSVRRGRDRAFHQWWLEQGTQPRIVAKFSNKPYGRRGHLRRIPGKPAVEVRPHMVSGQNAYIASSFNKLGPFKMQATPRAPRGEEGQRVQTDPAYPRAFFKKSKNPIVIPPMTPGGRAGRPPVETAFRESQQAVAEILQRELRITLEEAISTISRSIQGTISS